jgi:hypothetical protein
MLTVYVPVAAKVFCARLKLAMWTRYYDLPGGLRVQMRPHRAGSELLELGVYDKREEKLANVIFAPIHDRRGRSILSLVNVRSELSSKINFALR